MANKIKAYNKDPLRAMFPGKRFHLDYMFVRRKDTFKQEDGPLLTSKNDYNYYLLIAYE